MTSRLLACEVWTRVHARGLAMSHRVAVEQLLARMSFLELTPVVLARALRPWPVPLRTLDALHLASAEHLRERGAALDLATYDARMAEAGRRLGMRVLG